MPRKPEEPEVIIIDDDDEEAEKSSHDNTHPTYECLAIPGTSQWYPTALAQSFPPIKPGTKRRAYLVKKWSKRRRLHDKTKKQFSVIASASIPVDNVSSKSSISSINQTSEKFVNKSEMETYNKLLKFIKNHPEIISNPAVAEIGEMFRSKIESYTTKIINGLQYPEEVSHSDIQEVIDLTQLEEISPHVTQQKVVIVKPIQMLKPLVVAEEPPKDCSDNTPPIVHSTLKHSELKTKPPKNVELVNLCKKLSSRLYGDDDYYDDTHQQLCNMFDLNESNSSELSRTKTEEFKEEADNNLLNPTETEASHNYMSTEELRQILESPVGANEPSKDGFNNTQRTVYSLLCPLHPKISPMSSEEEKIDTTCDTFIPSDSEKVRANLDTAVKKRQLRVVLDELNTKTLPINSGEEEIYTYHSNRVQGAPGSLSKPPRNRSDDTQLIKTDEDLALLMDSINVDREQTSSPAIGFTTSEWETLLDKVVDSVMKHAKIQNYFKETQLTSM